MDDWIKQCKRTYAIRDWKQVESKHRTSKTDKEKWLEKTKKQDAFI